MKRFRDALRAVRVEQIYRIPEADLVARREALAREAARIEEEQEKEKARRVLPSIPALRENLEQLTAYQLLYGHGISGRSFLMNFDTEGFLGLGQGRIMEEIARYSLGRPGEMREEPRGVVNIGIDYAAAEQAVVALSVEDENVRPEQKRMQSLRRNVLGKKGRW